MVSREKRLRSLLGQSVHVRVDRPMGYVHKGMTYPVNYGYVPAIYAADGEEQDAYVLGMDEPVDSFDGEVIAVVHRKDDAEDKWVVSAKGMHFTREDIVRQIAFTEQYFCSELEMKA